jgi:nucleoside-diphosphate-sugar epimerase
MRILVIGGTRFMGPYIVDRLHAAGHTVTIFHRGQTSNIELPTGVEEILGDCDRLTDYTEQLRNLRADAVLDMMVMTEAQAHLVMETFVGFADRLVVLSSQDVYRAFGRVNGIEGGEVDPSPISEDSPLRETRYPYRHLSKSSDELYYNYDKILVEEIVTQHPDLACTILRAPAVYGPRDHQHRMFPYLKRMLDGRPAILLEEPVAQWRWAHGYVENIADSIVLAITDERASGRIYNIGEPFALSTIERVKRIAQACDWHGRIIALPEERIPAAQRWGINAAQDVISDTSRIRGELGYNERIDLEEAFRRTIAWESANPPEKVDPAGFDYDAEDKVLAER